MNDPRALVEKQVRRVRRRLFAQIVVHSMLSSWAIALLLTTLWFLIQPFTFAGFGESVRWGAPCVFLAGSSLGGLVLAWMRRPGMVASSLALDEKFGLRERVTTLLTLTPGQRDSPMGQALLRDATEHLTTLELAGQFPLRISWQNWLMPAGAFALAALACLSEPLLSDWKLAARASADQLRQATNEKEVQNQMDNLKKVVNQRSQEPETKSEQLKELEEEFAKLINQPIDSKNEEKVREQISKMRNLEEKMKERLDGLKDQTEKIDQLKKQLEKLNFDKDAKLKDGPAKDFEDALQNGEFNKARDVLDKLAKDLKNDKLSREKKKEIAEQFQKLQDKMKRLLDNDDRLKQLKQDAKDGKISKEELQRAMENFKDLQDLTDILGEARESLEKLGGKEAAEKLDKLKERFERIELTEDEVRDLLRDQDDLDEATRIMMAAMAGRDGEGDDDDNGDGMGGGRFPGRKRRINPKDPDSKIVKQRQKAELDPKGMQRLTGYARGGNFNKVPAKAVEGAFQQAVQDAPEAIERQRIPAAAADIARGYFRKLGNQK